MTCTDSFADIRIQFAPGRTSATMRGSLGKGGAVCYVAGARSGQTLNATVSSTNGRVKFRSTGDTGFTEIFGPFGRSPVLCLNNGGGSTSYTLTVSIQ